jgi:hypothetical protein
MANIAVFRQALFARVTHDSSLVEWRAVAKDGFTLPTAQATLRPSRAQVSSGETADFELTPGSQGELRLEVGVPRRGGAVLIEGVVKLHVVAP